MAISQVYTAVPGDVITAARWNNEFGNIYNNGTSLAFPLTTGVSFAGKTVSLDAAGVTTITSTAGIALSFTPGAKAGTPSTTGSNINVVASTFTDSATAGSGTATAFASIAIQRPTLAATNTSVTTTNAATLYIENAPLAGTNETLTNAYAIWVGNGKARFDGAIVSNSSLLVGSILAGKLIGGLTYLPATDAANDITVAVGEAVSDNATLASRRLMVLETAIVGQVDTGTWVVGTNQPKLDTGTVANVNYYIWLIQRADTGVVDILFSASGTAPTMPTNYTFKRLIGWFNRVSSVNLAFTTTELSGGGINFNYTTTLNDVATTALTTSRRIDTLSVPITFSVRVHIRVIVDDAAIATVLVMCPDETDAAPSTTTAPGFNLRSSVAGVIGSNELFIKTSATGTVASRVSANTMDAFDIITIGFDWSRR